MAAHMAAHEAASPVAQHPPAAAAPVEAMDVVEAILASPTLPSPPAAAERPPEEARLEEGELEELPQPPKVEAAPHERLREAAPERPGGEAFCSHPLPPSRFMQSRPGACTPAPGGIRDAPLHDACSGWATYHSTHRLTGADAALCYMGAQWWFLRRWCLRLTGAWTLWAHHDKHPHCQSACLRTAHCRRIARAHGTAPSATARRRTDAEEGGTR
jgi:hypothetical protein